MTWTCVVQNVFWTPVDKSALVGVLYPCRYHIVTIGIGLSKIVRHIDCRIHAVFLCATL